MRCQVVRGHLQDLLEERLPAQSAAGIRHHLSICPACSEELSAWRTIMARLDGLAPAPAVPDLEAAILGSLEQDLALPKGLILLFALASLGTLWCLLAMAEGLAPVSEILSALFWTIAGAAGVLSVWFAVERSQEAHEEEIAGEDCPECYLN